MGIKGDIKNLNLADIFQGLANNQQQGTLIVSDGESTKHIYFRRGKVCFLSSGRKKGLKLARILVRRGIITQREAEIAMNKQLRVGGLLGSILVEMGVCTEADIVDAVRFQIEQEIYSLFTWKDATFEFAETLPDEAVFADERMFTETTFDVGGLLLEAARRVDEWLRIEEKIPSFKEIYKTLDDEAAKIARVVDANTHEGIVLGLVDGRRDVEEIIAEAAIGYFETCQAICLLMDRGKIEPVPFEDLMRTADQLLESHTTDKAIGFYLRAVEMKPREVRVRFCLSEAYRQKNDAAQAVEQLKEAASIYCGLGEMNRASEVLRGAAELMPTDLDCQERLYRIYVEMGQTELAVRQGKELASRLRRTGDAAKKKEVYESLIKLAPTDDSIRKLLINHYLDMRDTERAVDQYEILAESMMAQGRPDGVMEIYRKILTCDPKRNDIRWRLDNLFAGERRRRKRRRLILGAASVTAVLALAGLYQYMASYKFTSLVPRAQAAVLRKDYDQAIGDYEALLQNYPWTFSAARAGRTLLDLKRERAVDRSHLKGALEEVAVREREARQDEARELLLNLRDRYRDTIYMERIESRLRDLEKSESEARMLSDLGRSYEARGDIRRSFEAYAELFWKYGNTSYAKNVQFPVRVESDPEGADVQINGQRMGRTPMTISYDPRKEFVMELRSPDYDVSRITKVNAWLIGEKLQRKIRWRYTTSQPVEGSGLVAGENYYIGGRDGDVYCMNVTSGEVRWRYHGGDVSDVVAGIAAGKENLFFGSVNGTLTALNMRTGEKAWQFDTGRPIRTTPVHVAELGVVIVPGGDGVLYVLAADTGRKAWQFDAGSPMVAEGVSAGTRYYFGTTGGRLICCDLADGKVVWSTLLDGPIHAAPTTALSAGSGSVLYVGTARGSVWAVGAAGGQVIWKSPGHGEIFGAAACDDERVYVGTGSSTVAALSRRDGATVWTAKTGGQVYASPLLYHERLYVGCIDGHFYAMDVRNGGVIWSFKSGGAIYGSASVYQDGVLFGSGDYNVYSLCR